MLLPLEINLVYEMNVLYHNKITDVSKYLPLALSVKPFDALLAIRLLHGYAHTGNKHLEYLFLFFFFLNVIKCMQ